MTERFKRTLFGLAELQLWPTFARKRTARGEVRPPARLYALACRVGKGMNFDDDVVFAAAWMHDLGVFLGHRPSDPDQPLGPRALHHHSHARTAFGLEDSVEKVEGVVAAIRTHQPQDEPETLEAVILRDADILEQLGAVGAMRAVCKIGRDTHDFLRFRAWFRCWRRRLPPAWEVAPGERAATGGGRGPAAAEFSVCASGRGGGYILTLKASGGSE